MAQIVKTKISLVKDMIFKCDMNKMKVNDCYIDESNENEADKLGPTPTILLAHALLGCLSSSFIFCLSKKNLNLDDLEAEAEVEIGRNEKGFLRVLKVNVDIKAKIDDPDARKRADQCKKMFENYCTVTAAVRDGIEVNVNVNY